MANRSHFHLFALVWLLALNLRSTTVAISPLLPFIRSDYHLSFSFAGALASLPLLCLGLAAIPGALMANRAGARSLIGIGLAGVAVGGLLRIVPHTLFALFLGTFLLSISGALAQPAVASLLRNWFGRGTQQASANYTLAINLGALVATSGTGYLLIFGGWRGALLIWAVPPLIVMPIWFLFAPAVTAHSEAPKHMQALLADGRLWTSAALFGAQSIVYITAISWLPFIFEREGAQFVSLVLLVLGVAAVPCGILLTITRFPFATSRTFHVVTGSIMLVGTVGFALDFRSAVWVLALLLGIGCALAFTAAIALPSLLAEREGDVASYSGLVFTGGYAISFIGPLVSGALLDRTGLISSTFWPAIIASIVTIVLGATIQSGRVSSANATVLS